MKAEQYNEILVSDEKEHTLIHVMPWMNLRNMLREESQAQKDYALCNALL